MVQASTHMKHKSCVDSDYCISRNLWPTCDSFQRLVGGLWGLHHREADVERLPQTRNLESETEHEQNISRICSILNGFSTK